MPRKTFVAGDVLTASQVNTFLMDQSVMTFADSDARGSAIPTPSEGMVTYLDDTNALEVFDGSSFVPAAPASGGSGNAIINGAFEINQRGFSSSTATGFGFDRWNNNFSGATGTFSAQTFALGTEPVAGFDGANFLRAAITTGNDFCGAIHKVEDVKSFAGQTVTVSFYAKGTNPTTAGNLKFRFVRNYGSGGSAFDVVTQETFVLTANFTRYSFTIAVPSLSGKTLGAGNFVELTWGQGDSVSTDAWELDLWGVQVEAGSTATEFRRNANSLQGELAACQRYFYQFLTGNNKAIGLGVNLNASTCGSSINFPVTMRIAPALIASSGTNFYCFERSVEQDFFNSFTINRPTETTAIIINSTEVSGTTGVGGLMYSNNASASIAFNSEL